MNKRAYGKQLPVQDDVHVANGEFSPDQVYRYWLLRVWGVPGCSLLTVIGMNPSSADSDHDDRTVRRCIGFARDYGYGGLLMLNAWAVRGTDPATLREDDNPVGPANDAWIREVASSATWETNGYRYGLPRVVAAWGNNGSLNQRGAEVANMCRRHGRDLWCFGTTKRGHPKHPLYLPSDTVMERLLDAT